MFSQLQTPTATPFEIGYVSYLRLNSITGMVMSGLYQVMRARIGMHLKHDAEGNTVIGLHLLGQSSKDQQIARSIHIELRSDFPDGFLFAITVLGKTEERRFHFADDNGKESEEHDTHIATQLVNAIGQQLQVLYAAPPEMIALAQPEIQTAQDGSFMKPVKSVTDLGINCSNYEVEFEDGVRIRFSMDSRSGERIAKGDWLYHDPTGGVKHIPRQSVN